MDNKPSKEPFILPMGAPQPLLPVGQCLGAAFPEDEQPLPESMQTLLGDLSANEPGTPGRKP